MQIHQIKPTIKLKKKKRIGRGGKKGTYSGKGIKGQKSRAGKKLVPVVRGIIKKYHKLKGYRFNGINKEKIATINLTLLNNKFNNNEIISPGVLVEKRLIRKINGKIPLVKILGNGNLTKTFIFKDCKFSKSAEEKIKKIENNI